MPAAVSPQIMTPSNADMHKTADGIPLVEPADSVLAEPVKPHAVAFFQTPSSSRHAVLLSKVIATTSAAVPLQSAAAYEAAEQAGSSFVYVPIIEQQPELVQLAVYDSINCVYVTVSMPLELPVHALLS